MKQEQVINNMKQKNKQCGNCIGKNMCKTWQYCNGYHYYRKGDKKYEITDRNI